MKTQHMKVFLNAAILLSLILLFNAANTSAEPPLKVGASDAPPYYIVKDDNVSGIFGELISKIFAKADLPFIWKPYPTKRIYNSLVQGSLDLYLGPLKPEFEGFNDSVIHSTFSPVKIELCSYYFGDKPKITKKEELSQKRILIINGYTYGGLVNYIFDPKNKVDYREIYSFEQAIKMLKAGRSDYHLDYKKTGEIYMKDNSEPDLKHTTLFSVDLYFMVSNHTPNAKDLLAKIKAAFHQVKE